METQIKSRKNIIFVFESQIKIRKNILAWNNGHCPYRISYLFLNLIEIFLFSLTFLFCLMFIPFHWVSIVFALNWSLYRFWKFYINSNITKISLNFMETRNIFELFLIFIFPKIRRISWKIMSLCLTKRIIQNFPITFYDVLRVKNQPLFLSWDHIQVWLY
jgi:hypothetical protein